VSPFDPATYQSLVSGWLSQLPLAYAFGAGIVASVNPCGFLMLPAYATYYVSSDDRQAQTASATARSLRAVQLGLLVTAGFLSVFAPLGLAISLGGHALTRVFPYTSLLIGGVLIALGLFLLASRRHLGLAASERVRLRRSKSPRGVFLFGIAYAVASLGCTLPVFLLVVGSALASSHALTAFIQFLNYALGMGLVLTVVSVSAALAQGAITQRLQRLLPYVERAGGVLLVAAGAYLVYYWYTFGRVLS
jgi:cytochrome c-type biogenesis protein